jgi:hypothetical protein
LSKFRYWSNLQNHFISLFWSFLWKLGTSIILVQSRWNGNQNFLPFELLKSTKVSYEGHLLASENKTLIEFKKTDFVVEQSIHLYSLPCVYCVIKQTHQSILPQRNGIIRNLLHGLVCIRHLELGYNNILLFNPTLLGLLYFYWTKKKKRYLQSGGKMYSFNYLHFVLINKAHFLLVLPLVVCSYLF